MSSHWSLGLDFQEENEINFHIFCYLQLDTINWKLAAFAIRIILWAELHSYIKAFENHHWHTLLFNFFWWEKVDNHHPLFFKNQAEFCSHCNQKFDRKAADLMVMTNSNLRFLGLYKVNPMHGPMGKNSGYRNGVCTCPRAFFA